MAAPEVQLFYPSIAEALKCGLLGTGSADLYTAANCGHYLFDANYVHDPTVDNVTAFTVSPYLAQTVWIPSYVNALSIDATGTLSQSAAETMEGFKQQGNANAVDVAVPIAYHNNAGISKKWKPILAHRGLRNKSVLAAENHSLVAGTLPWSQVSATKPDALPVYDDFWRECWLALLQGTSAGRFGSTHTLCCHVLNDGYVYSAAHKTLDDIGSSYFCTVSASYATCASPTATASASGIVVDSSDPVNNLASGRSDGTGSWWQNGNSGAWDDITEGSGPATQLLLYITGLGSGASTMLVACFPLPTPLFETTSGGSYNSQWNVATPAAGWFSLANPS